jgi:phosphoribosyl-ATP pyrophosphohydrolase
MAMVHSLETMAKLNEAASVAVAAAVADVRYVVCQENCDAVYVDGVLLVHAASDWAVSVGILGASLKGRHAKITNVRLASDWPGNAVWPRKYIDLTPYIDTES